MLWRWRHIGQVGKNYLEGDSVTDPVFGEITFGIDAWDGIFPFIFVPAGTRALALHIWADGSGPSGSQRRTFAQLQERYVQLWPAIVESLRDCHPQLQSTEQVEHNLNPIIGCYIQDVTTFEHNDFELVYEFDLDDENGRGFFVRISGWRIIDAVVAE
jgi:hypothetical protein